MKVIILLRLVKSHLVNDLIALNVVGETSSHPNDVAPKNLAILGGGRDRRRGLVLSGVPASALAGRAEQL